MNEGRRYNQHSTAQHRVLLWGMGEVFRDNVWFVKYHEARGQFKIVGAVAKDSIYREFWGVERIEKADVDVKEIDFVIIMAKGKSLLEIHMEALDMGFEEEQLIPCIVLRQMTFDLEKYVAILKNPPTIFANNCWGGLTYHSLGLKFASPLIDMSESELDYLKLLKNPQNYMDEKIRFHEMKWGSKGFYPVAECGDILLSFIHYKTFDDANEKWEKRKKRINWNNLFVMMYTENREWAEEFASLPFKKKVCFVPFESTDPSVVCIEFRNRGKMAEWPFADVVTKMARGICPYYDVFDLVGEGKFTKIVRY